MTESEKQQIINEVLDSLKVNSLTIEQLVEVASFSSDDCVELTGGRRISLAMLKELFNKELTETVGKKLAISDLASGRGESTTTAMTQAAVTQELVAQEEKLTELSSQTSNNRTIILGNEINDFYIGGPFHTDDTINVLIKDCSITGTDDSAFVAIGIADDKYQLIASIDGLKNGDIKSKTIKFTKKTERIRLQLNKSPVVQTASVKIYVDTLNVIEQTKSLEIFKDDFENSLVDRFYCDIPHFISTTHNVNYDYIEDNNLITKCGVHAYKINEGTFDFRIIIPSDIAYYYRGKSVYIAIESLFKNDITAYVYHNTSRIGLINPHCATS